MDNTYPIKCPHCKKYTNPPNTIDAPVLVVKGEIYWPNLVSFKCGWCKETITVGTPKETR